MATTFHSGSQSLPAAESRFFFRLSLIMALVVVAGFSLQLAMGRSTFAAPWPVHAHAVIFFGWVVIFLAQAWLAQACNRIRHRQLGLVAGGWMVLMLIAGLTVTITMARSGRVPFFFYPQQFLIADPVTLLTFIGLTIFAFAMRRQADWHMRLQISAFAALMGPAFGRLLPMPLLAPHGFEIAALAPLIFVVFGMARDRKRLGRIHPAWIRGCAALIGMVLLFDLVAYSPLGDAIYQAAVAGSPGAAIPGLALPSAPEF